MSSMDAAKASAASGTRHWRSVRKTLSLKAPRSGIMNRQKSQGSKGDGN
jgi:hypothetical protein